MRPNEGAGGGVRVQYARDEQRSARLRCAFATRSRIRAASLRSGVTRARSVEGGSPKGAGGCFRALYPPESVY